MTTLNSYPTMTLQPLKGQSDLWEIEFSKLSRPFIAISHQDYEQLIKNPASYYLMNGNQVVTFGANDDGYAIMPLNKQAAKSILRENGITEPNPDHKTLLLAALTHFAGAVEAGENLSYLKMTFPGLDLNELDGIKELIDEVKSDAFTTHRSVQTVVDNYATYLGDRIVQKLTAGSSPEEACGYETLLGIEAQYIKEASESQFFLPEWIRNFTEHFASRVDNALDNGINIIEVLTKDGVRMLGRDYCDAMTRMSKQKEQVINDPHGPQPTL